MLKLQELMKAPKETQEGVTRSILKHTVSVWKQLGALNLQRMLNDGILKLARDKDNKLLPINEEGYLDEDGDLCYG